jgi:hypothetical protein
VRNQNGEKSKKPFHFTFNVSTVILINNFLGGKKLIEFAFINNKSNQFDLLDYTGNLIKEIVKEIEL